MSRFKARGRYIDPYLQRINLEGVACAYTFFHLKGGLNIANKLREVQNLAQIFGFFIFLRYVYARHLVWINQTTCREK